MVTKTLEANNPNLSRREKIKLFFSRQLKYIAFIFLATPMYLIWLKYTGYTIRNLKKVRKELALIQKKHKGPLLICPNHLTLVDSLLIANCLGGFWDYLLNFKRYAWNVPKASYSKNSFFRFIFHISKVIPIKRDGSAEEQRLTMQKISYLLSQGEYVLVFPEGTRSLTGRVDSTNFSYSVGSLLRQVPDAKVLAVYLRAVSDNIESTFPVKSEQFDCQIKLINPKSAFKGLRADRDLATQIIHCLVEMEEAYLAQKQSS